MQSPIVLVFNDFQDWPLVMVFQPDCKWYDVALRSNGAMVGLIGGIPADVEQFIRTLSDVAYHSTNPESKRKKTAECAEILAYLMANSCVHAVICGVVP